MPSIENPLPDAESKPEYVRRGFDAIASRYDRLNDLMTAGLHRRWKREAVRRLGLQPGMRVLDFCSGTGDLGWRTAGCIQPGGLVAALDFSPRMIDAGRKRAQAWDIESVLSWIHGDATQLPFMDACFDGAMVGFGLRNVASIPTALCEVYRVLRPGGRFVNLDTAESEWKAIRPLYRLYMNRIVPLLGQWFAGSKEMYAYLSSSAAVFETPEQLTQLLQENGWIDTGFAYRPRILGGAALVWGRKPE